MKIIATLWFVLVAGAAGAFGCPRAETGEPVCAFYTRAEVVFLGKAVKVESVGGKDDFAAGARKIRFQVLRNFKGADNPTLSIVTNGPDADCGLDIKSGQTWVVYGALDQIDKFFHGFRGRKIDPKAPDAELDALQRIAEGKTDAMLAGRLTTGGGAYAAEPVEVALEGRGGRQTAQSDADGMFRFAPLAEGKYKVRLTFPFRADLKWDQYLLGTNFAAGPKSVFDYEISLRDGDCVFHLFEVTKPAP